MTTFSCGKNQSIVIGDGIVVTVLDIQGDSVELSIEHPDGTSVRRVQFLDAVVENEECCQAVLC
jgi:carbon storage regulator CsrA